ncbi:DUF6107 family protein [Ochrobactrum sp. RH2CCR150]|uniref:DUF6107 family protein n=1 Tax=Ochrobactrum sp. RH2CCR150 TaxID=2587044 RepID=UPI00180772BF|nr:hypothetical protein [Ochrobactrum sp. RH2CCR150]
MNNLNDMLVSAVASTWFVKVAGAVAGAVVSLVYTFPRSRREMGARLVVGVICGVIFGGAVVELPHKNRTFSGLSISAQELSWRLIS